MTTLLDQALVLRVLHPGRQFTDRQIAAQTALSIRRTRHALRTLHGNGLLRQVTHRHAWEFPSCGRAYTHTPTGRAMLDVLRSALAE